MTGLTKRILGAVIGAAIVASASVVSAQEAPTVASIVEAWTKSAHADVSAEAFSHWNDDGKVPPACAMCHAGAGLRSFYGFDGSPAGEITEQPVGGVIDCDTCHEKDKLREIVQVSFPSGISLPAPEGNGTCYTCHQGRQSGPGVAGMIAGMDPDAVNPDLTFQNPHYAAAAATMHGAEASGAFEYDLKTYLGLNSHAPGAAVCTDCHSPHSLQVKTTSCVDCHSTEDPKAIRIQTADYDGDGDTVEGIAGEIATLHSELGAAITAYAAETVGAPIVYAAANYPYYFADTNANAAVDEGEAIYPNKYASWTPRLLAAAYNYQFVAKDPGGYAHNPHYIIQVLLDSIQDITGAETTSALRP